MARNKLTYARVSISNIKSSIVGYKLLYYKAMQRLMRDAAGVFVHSAVGHVHVDTGMSAASLEPFAKKAGTSIMGRFSPRRSRFGGTTLSGRYYPKKVRNVYEGLKAGRTAFKFNYGTYLRPYMSFEFAIKVWQYQYWEPDWQSLNEAHIDAEIFIENNYEKYLPKGIVTPFKFTSKVSY